MSIVGNTYLERGEPVTVLAQWRGKVGVGPIGGVTLIQYPEGYTGKSGPRNVLIRRADGDLVVRPFRGLRRVTQETTATHTGGEHH